jgi:hypothetical protein
MLGAEHIAELAMLLSLGVEELVEARSIELAERVCRVSAEICGGLFSFLLLWESVVASAMPLSGLRSAGRHLAEFTSARTGR